MLNPRNIILSVAFLFVLTSLRILSVARVATQGTLFDIRYMNPPLLPDSYDVASMMPELPTIVSCAASIIKEGDRSILTIMLLTARFVEAIINILSSKWVIGLGIFKLVVSAAITLYKLTYAPVGDAAQEPSPRLVDLTFRALGKSRFGDFFAEHFKATRDIQARLVVVESSIDQLS